MKRETLAWGSCLVRLGEDEQASRLLSRILTYAPSHPLAFESGLLVAEIHRRAGRVRQAAALLERLLAQTREASLRVPVHLRLGAVRLDQGDAASAKNHFTAVLQAPELESHLAAVNGLGDVHMHLGEYQKAQRRYEETQRLSQRLSPTNNTFGGRVYAMYQLGRIQLLLGQHTEAVETFQRLLARTTLRIQEL